MSGGHLQSAEKRSSFSKFSRSGTARRVKMSVGVNYQEGAAINTDFPFCLAVEATMVCDSYEIIGKC